MILAGCWRRWRGSCAGRSFPAGTVSAECSFPAPARQGEAGGGAYARIPTGRRGQAHDNCAEVLPGGGWWRVVAHRWHYAASSRRRGACPAGASSPEGRCPPKTPVWTHILPSPRSRFLPGTGLKNATCASLAQGARENSRVAGHTPNTRSRCLPPLDTRTPTRSLFLPLLFTR